MKDISKQIALTLRNLRHERGWSLDKAAKETGVSKAMLGQIEREESSPTIATLWKIASGFESSFSAFVEEMEQGDFSKPMHRAGKVKAFHPEDKKIRVMSLFPFDKQLKCEFFVIELLPGCEHLSPAHEKGVVEHVIVVEGKIEIFVNEKWEPLAKGEGLRFDANQVHGYRNITAKKASFHDIVHYPNKKDN